MIEVTLTLNNKTELGRIKIINLLEERDDDLSDYSVQFAVERCGAVGLHQRAIHDFPRTKYNVLALLFQALKTLDESELKLEDGVDSSDLARRQRSLGREVQGW